ncbi:dimethylarginine dimethylaminohydrolase [Roseibium sp. CAU 1637]|uniref:Dimethylarginine dimethylaminohydrolase n=1 Tax=Roseibium limicola TaxID=2816037 RepID=A0A939J6M4_9HYPH|nr:arginine deiminase family protein [Roseibium limicola]MBO0345277.1 dimethylarginine dimethylaminohydrolase [Roseibium limicola]
MPQHPGLSWQFSHAITRTPADSIARGLRAVDTGNPDPYEFRVQHAVYVGALEAVGMTVDVLPALEDFPDSCFVEDPAFCLPEGAILLRPGHATRIDEPAQIRSALAARYDTVLEIPGKGHVDGGDVLTLDDEILIGLSARTDREGAEAFAKLLREWGYTPRVAETPEGVLHFKTACSTLGDDVILATKPMIDSGFFGSRVVVPVADGEDYCANVIRVNDVVLVPEDYPQTLANIEAAGFKTRLMPVSEPRKVDGGLSCLSLRFNLG